MSQMDVLDSFITVNREVPISEGFKVILRPLSPAEGIRVHNEFAEWANDRDERAKAQEEQTEEEEVSDEMFMAGLCFRHCLFAINGEKLEEGEGVSQEKAEKMIFLAGGHSGRLARTALRCGGFGLVAEQIEDMMNASRQQARQASDGNEPPSPDPAGGQGSSPKS